MSAARTRLAEHPHPGFFGKVPARGDFVHADLNPRFHEEFDRWLQHGMTASQQALGEGWRDRFLAAPPWRFVLSAGLCGPHAVAGVFLPSRDRVGRCFPLVVTATLQDFSGDPGRIAHDRRWFTTLEAVAATAVTADADVAGFRAKLRRIRPLEVRFGSDGAASAGPARSHWWAADDPGLARSSFSMDGMPVPDDFVAFLPSVVAVPSPWARALSSQEQASSAPRGPSMMVGEQPPAKVALRSAAALNPPEAAPPAKAELPRPVPSADGRTLPLRKPVAALTVRAVVAQCQGLKAQVQAEVAILRPEIGLFGIVSALAEDRTGVSTARTIAEALESIAAQQTIEALVGEVKGKLGRAHAILRAGGLSAPALATGASVTVLASVGGRLSCVWAGDIRCYLLRDGMMRCITRDHVEVGMRRRLSRSIGGDGAGMPDTLSDVVQPGDRLLLCSSALPRVVGERSVAETMIASGEQSAERLIQDAMIAGVAENVTAVIVDAESADAIRPHGGPGAGGTNR